MAEDSGNGSEVAVEVAGQKFNVRNVKDINTVATLATLVIVLVIAVVGYNLFTAHAADTKDASKELVAALKEMTQAAREQNCLIAMPQDRRDPELCRRIAR